MSNANQKNDLMESISATGDEGDAGPQAIRPAAQSSPSTKRRRNYDGSKPLDYPGHEALAQYLAAPQRFRRFRSITALAIQFNVSRVTVYRWAQHLDVVRRAAWLSAHNRILGDFIACREWPAIIRAQVTAALAGDTRAAIFCQSRAWPEGIDFAAPSLEEAVEGEINVGTFLEEDEAVIQSEQPGTANKNPGAQEDEDLEE
jgi:hypothetical protein